MMKTAWTIAASDSSNGAGIQADLACFDYFGVHGCSIITKITAQNSSGIISSYTIPDDIIKQQLAALCADVLPTSIKLSVIATNSQLNILADFVKNYSGAIVYDPVLYSSTDVMLSAISLDQLSKLLLPSITLITPNILEAQNITGIKINSAEDMRQAALALLAFGVKNILLKGGHSHDIDACDLFMNSSQEFWLSSKRIIRKMHVHGTGCHLSSAITANMALGYSLIDAIILGKRYINAAINESYLPHANSKQYYMRPNLCKINADNMPKIYDNHINIEQIHLNHDSLPCQNLGLYAVVDTSQWVAKLITYGVKTIQLRIKGVGDYNLLEYEIATSVKLAKINNIQLFINDHWELAIKYKAYGVHLGQEDIQSADIAQIKQHGLRLGISTHSYYELAIALSHRPSYIALGPIYTTYTKVMPWQPQGISRINEWKALVGCPLVVIGGIGLHNIDEVLTTGITNIAMVSAITKADNPEYIIKQLLNKINLAQIRSDYRGHGIINFRNLS